MVHYIYMAENIPVIPLQSMLSLPETPDKEYIKIMIQDNIPVLCVNRSTKTKRIMPFKALFEHNNHFWLQRGSWDFFITQERFEGVKEKYAERSSNPEIDADKPI